MSDKKLTSGAYRIIHHYKSIQKALKYLQISGVGNYYNRFWADQIFITAYYQSYFVLGKGHNNYFHFNKRNESPIINKAITAKKSFYMYHVEHQLKNKKQILGDNIIIEANMSQLMSVFYCIVFYEAQNAVFKRVSIKYFSFDDEYYERLMKNYNRVWTPYRSNRKFTKHLAADITKDENLRDLFDYINEKGWERSRETNLKQSSTNVIRVDFRVNNRDLI
jgi:hypothetical protein